MVGWIVGDQHDPAHRRCAIGMGLKRGIPEILGIVMLTRPKAHARRFDVTGKRQREGQLHDCSVGLSPLAHEIEQLEIGYF